MRGSVERIVYARMRLEDARMRLAQLEAEPARGGTPTRVRGARDEVMYWLQKLAELTEVAPADEPSIDPNIDVLSLPLYGVEVV